MFKPKYPVHENTANKSTIITQNSDLDTATYNRTYYITGLTISNSLLAAAIGQLGDSHISRYLISDTLKGIIN